MIFLRLKTRATLMLSYTKKKDNFYEISVPISFN